MYEAVLDLPAAIFVGVGLLAVGSLIRFRRSTFLIAGYDDLAAVPQTVAATFAGNFLLRVAPVMLVSGYLSMEGRLASWIALAFGLFVVLDTGRVVYRLNTYDRSQRSEATL